MPRHSDVSRLRPGDIVHCSVTRADEYQPIGIEVQSGFDHINNNRNRNNQKIYIAQVFGLCENIPVQVGDELLKLNDIDVSQLRMDQIENMLKEEKRIAMVLRRCDVGAIVVASQDYVEDKENNNQKSVAAGASSRRSLYTTNPGIVRTSTSPTSAGAATTRTDDADVSTSSSEQDEGDYYDGFDYRPRPEYLRKESYDGSSVMSSSSLSSSRSFRPGHAAKLDNMLGSKKAKLQGQNVFLMHESTKRPGNFECELEDGSRILVSDKHLKVISEEEEASFQPYVPGSSTRMGNSRDSTRSAFSPNLIEPGDVMKIRGLKKQTKMNGAMVEILRPAQEHSGRWECVLCDDRDRIIAVMSENLRHIM